MPRLLFVGDSGQRPVRPFESRMKPRGNCFTYAKESPFVIVDNLEEYLDTLRLQIAGSRGDYRIGDADEFESAEVWMLEFWDQPTVIQAVRRYAKWMHCETDGGTGKPSSVEFISLRNRIENAVTKLARAIIGLDRDGMTPVQDDILETIMGNYNDIVEEIGREDQRLRFQK